VRELIGTGELPDAFLGDVTKEVNRIACIIFPAEKPGSSDLHVKRGMTMDIGVAYCMFRSSRTCGELKGQCACSELALGTTAPLVTQTQSRLNVASAAMMPDMSSGFVSLLERAVTNREHARQARVHHVAHAQPRPCTTVIQPYCPPAIQFPRQPSPSAVETALHKDEAGIDLTTDQPVMHVIDGGVI
jgi:hypothetical protein